MDTNPTPAARASRRPASTVLSSADSAVHDAARQYAAALLDLRLHLHRLADDVNAVELSRATLGDITQRAERAAATGGATCFQRASALTPFSEGVAKRVSNLRGAALTLDAAIAKRGLRR